MKRFISIIIIICLVTGCAGRTPRPVNAMNADDKTKSCEVLQNEILMANVAGKAPAAPADGRP